MSPNPDNQEKIRDVSEEVYPDKEEEKGNKKENKKGKRLPGLSVEEVIPKRIPVSYEVDGAKLLSKLKANLQRQVYITEHQCTAVCYWILHTYLLAATNITPRLHITSPEMRCGKTTLLSFINNLAHRPLTSGKITYSAMFQIIARLQGNEPTICLDEADLSLMGGATGSVNGELLTLVNEGNHRNAKVIKTVSGNGQEHVPRAFPVFAPMAICGIRDIPRTAADRSIRIALDRKPIHVNVERIPYGGTEELKKLANECQRFADDNVEQVKEIKPVLPEELTSDRARDNWKPLFAIATAIGGDAVDNIKRAAIALSPVSESTDYGTLLLSDIRDYFVKFPKRDFVFVYELDVYLQGLEERPWREYWNGKPIKPRKRASLLGAYKDAAGCPLTTNTIEREGKNLRGYWKKQFTKAWASYLPPSPPAGAVSPSGRSQGNGYSGNPSVRKGNNLTAKKAEKPRDSNDPDALTATAGQTGETDPLEIPDFLKRTPVTPEEKAKAQREEARLLKQERDAEKALDRLKDD